MIYDSYKVGGEIYHHGIAGQKWGQRNGPPYPLSDGAHSPSEKKKGWKSSLSSSTKINKTINKLKNKPVTDKEGIIIPVSLGVYALMTLSSLGITAGAAIAQKVKDKKIDKNYKKMQENKATEKTDSKTGLKIKNEQVKSLSEEEDLKMVNPRNGHSDNYSNASNNCVFCSLTYEMRKRGYDASANPSDVGFNGKAETKKIFSNVKTNNIDTYGIIKSYNNKKEEAEFKYTTFDERKKIDDLRNKAASNGNKDYAKSVLNNLSTESNSRGSLFVQWGVGGGHALSYKVENGTVTLIDPQIGKMYTGKQAERYLSSTWYASSMRLDKAKIDPKAKKYIKAAME